MQNKLEQKLKLLKDQRLGNAIMIIIAILILLFVPLFTFKNLRIELSLEWIIALVVLIVGIVRSIILNSKIEDLELDVERTPDKNNEAPEINTRMREVNFICKYCNSKFVSEQLLTKHYIGCSKKKRIEEEDTISFWMWGIYGFLAVLFFISVLIFIYRGMVSIFKIFIPISIIFIIGFVLYMEFYLKEKITNWVKKHWL